MIRVCAAALLLVGVASPCRAQDVEGYLALAREYAGGRGDEGTDRLASWPESAVSAAATIAATTASARDLQAAAMLHTDLANAMIDAEPEGARFHLKIAGAALTTASGRIGQRAHLEPFVRRWFRFVVSVYTSCELLHAAADHVRQGLAAFPEDPGLLVARGSIIEAGVRRNFVPDWRRGTLFSARQRDTVEEVMKNAAAQYIRALAIDSHNAEAHLHLGWVRLFMADGRARSELDAALADAQDGGVRYLAHLFLGGLAEPEQRLEDARREYEGARAAGPDYQTSYVALSRIEQALGHEDRARDLALAGLRLDKSDADDPWWDHRIGFDRQSLYWLRNDVRRPQ
jgi:tetratricopeptide (TPR) repeat protein